MNGNPFSIMTQHEATDLAATLGEDDEHWTYAAKPFDPLIHSGGGNSVSHLARKIVDAGGGDRRRVYFVVEVHDERNRFLGAL